MYCFLLNVIQARFGNSVNRIRYGGIYTKFEDDGGEWFRKYFHTYAVEPRVSELNED